MKIIKYILILAFAHGYAQDTNDDKLLAVSADACECISKIESDLESKNQNIQDCIKISLENATKDSLEKQDLEMNYKMVENYLVQHCQPLKELAFTENKKFKYASSDNVLAQLAYDDGMEYINDGDIENAIIKFSKAVEIDPNFAFAWDNMGISYRKNEQYEKAIEAYLKSLDQCRPLYLIVGSSVILRIFLLKNVFELFGCVVRQIRKRIFPARRPATTACFQRR